MRYELVLFDFDGTLCHTQPAITYCIKEILIRFGGKQLSDQEIAQHIGLGCHLEKGLKKLISPDLTAEDVTHLTNVYRNIYLAEGSQRTTLFPGVASVLKKLHAAGKSIAIVSNKYYQSIQTALDKFQLSAYIHLIIGDKPGAKRKPDLAIFSEQIQPYFNGIHPQKVLLVGDTATDLLFANNIGCDSCWAAYGYGEAQNCLPHHPTYVVQDLQELLELSTEHSHAIIS